MPPDPSFRLSLYLTLAAACACLGYAESALLPEVGAFAGAVIGALVVTYRLETRVRLLAIPDANKLGAGIGLVWLLWAAYRVAREVQTNEFSTLGWPLFFVALVAPLLMAAIAAKTLRGEKHAGDYWQLHAAGLGSVVMGCAMSERPFVLVLVGAYVVAGVWAVARFYHARADGTVPPIPGRGPAAGAAPATRPNGVVSRATFALPLAWAAAAGAVAAPLYLLTPRSSYGKLNFGQPRIEIGYAADQMINLNATGDLEENTETAFAVAAATPDDRPKTDLGPEQRWRGSVLTQYKNGAWQRDAPGEARLPHVAVTARAAAAWRPPDLGPEAYRLTFDVPTKLRTQVLADPVEWVANEPVPVADLDGGPPRPWYPLSDGSFARISGTKADGPVSRYVQYTRTPPDPDLGPGFALRQEPDRDLVTNPVGRVKAYADELAGRLVAEGRLPAGTRTRDAVRLRPPEEFHEAIARAFRDHLADHAGLKYTTALRRENKSVDPVEDFLFHAKAGHCERFATALVLLLRSQGIPAVAVLGFKGCDHQGGGRYVIRQSHAHAWVEALVSRPAATGGTGRGETRVWHWLALDPTPGDDAADADGATAAEDGELGQLKGTVRTAFDRYLVRYTPDQRERTVREAAAAATQPGVLAGVGGALLLACAAWAVRRRWSRRPAPPAEAAGWFGRLAATLAAAGYAPSPGETPLEFATATAAALRRRPATAHVAGVPVAWAEAYYQTRFGGAALPPDHRAALDAGLDELTRAIKTASGGTR